MTATVQTAGTLRDRVARGEMTAAAVCREHLERIAAANPQLNAFNTVTGERALARADELDRRRAAGEVLGPLAGVPVAVKDNLCVDRKSVV